MGDIISSMAGQAEPQRSKELVPVPDLQTPTAVVEVDNVQLAAAQLYGRGYKRRQIQNILLDHLAPKERDGRRNRTREEQQSLARAKLKRWERTEKFRDMVYEHAVIELDMETPQILQGVARRAKRGRVDAARLSLEVTGRHNPKGDQQPAQVVVQIANIPRPE